MRTRGMPSAAVIPTKYISESWSYKEEFVEGTHIFLRRPMTLGMKDSHLDVGMSRRSKQRRK
jgi:hypothetical protein